MDALHGYYYACGYEQGEVVYPPAYISETEVLALQNAGYTLRACEQLSLNGVEKADPVRGLQNAAIALSEKEKFGELTALYVRKSSAEINAEQKK